MRLKIGEDLKRRSLAYVKNNDLGKRYSAEKNQQENFVGILGEVAVRNHYGIYTDLTADFDGGHDFEYYGNKISVKTTGGIEIPSQHHSSSFVAYSKDLKADSFVISYYNKKTSELFLLGWVTKEELKEKGEKLTTGTERTAKDGSTYKVKAPTYVIKASDLNPMHTL